MFTGIVEEMGRLVSTDGTRFEFEADTVLEDAEIGDSLAHNGCCLTLVEIEASRYAVELTEETLARTDLGDLKVGDKVNLERPVRLADRLGGHLVQGHVDAVGRIVRGAPDLEVEAPSEVMRYIVEKGSITVDGVSLTVVEAKSKSFTVAVIPHTAAVTTLGLKGPGATVNLEVDVIAKYVERITTYGSNEQEKS